MITLATDIPAEVIREPGFANWIVYGLVALFIAREIRAWIVPARNEISGTVGTKAVVEHAEQSDLDTLAETVNAMREEITAQFRDAKTAGENRVAAITTDINDQMRVLSSNVGDLGKNITQAMIDNSRQSAEIEGLKSADFRHDGTIARIQQNIAELMRGPPHKRSA